MPERAWGFESLHRHQFPVRRPFFSRSPPFGLNRKESIERKGGAPSRKFEAILGGCFGYGPSARRLFAQPIGLGRWTNTHLVRLNGARLAPASRTKSRPYRPVMLEVCRPRPMAWAKECCAVGAGVRGQWPEVPLPDPSGRVGGLSPIWCAKFRRDELQSQT